MKVGDKVTIFDDPITEMKPEGKATLLTCVDIDPGQPIMERWQVHFDDDVDDCNVSRVIKRHGKNTRVVA